MKIRAMTVIGIVSILLVGCNDGAASDQVYQLDFNTQTPSTHAYNANAIEPWAELVEEETNGQVQINVYENGALGGNSTAYEDIQNGVYDIGYLLPRNVSGTSLFPLTISNLPFSFEDNQQLATVMEQYIDEFVEDSFSENVKYMSIAGTDASRLISQEPIETAEDLSGREISISSEYNADVLRNLSASPTNVEVSELYQSLDRGVIGGIEYTLVGAVSLGLYEVAPFLMDMPMNTSALIYVMNNDAFEEMPEDLQRQFDEELFPALSELILEAYNNEEETAVQDFEEGAENYGGRVVEPSEQDIQQFYDLSADVWEQWISEADEAGYQGEEMMDFYIEVIEDEGGETPLESS